MTSRLSTWKRNWPDDSQSFSVSVSWWFLVLIVIFFCMMAVPLAMLMLDSDRSSYIFDIILTAIGVVFAVCCLIWTLNRKLQVSADGQIVSSSIGKSVCLNICDAVRLCENGERLRVFDASGRFVSIPVYVSRYRLIRRLILVTFHVKLDSASSQDEHSKNRFVED